MAARAEVAKRRLAALERAREAVGGSIRHRMIPPAKAPELERELYIAELIARFAEGQARLERSIDALIEAIGVLQSQAIQRAPAKPEAKAPKPKASEAGK